MANEKEGGGGKSPEALTHRHRTVTLKDGSTVVVHKWGRDKFYALIPLVGDLKESPTLAEQSVAAEDRERVRAMDPDDLLTISIEATALNVTEAVLKNLGGLLDQSQALRAALKLTNSPSNPK